MIKDSDVIFSSLKNIIDERRNTSDFMWVSREIDWAKSYRQNHDTSNPYKFQYDVLKSSKIKKLIEDVSKEQNIAESQVERRVIELLKEIGHSRDPATLRVVGLVFVKAAKKIFDGIYVNEDRLLEIKKNMGSNPVVFVPSHRSYFDFCMMSFITFTYEIETPCIAAGMDFMSMFLMGEILRKCNAFYMRRSFGDDHLYRTVFQEYVRHLVTAGDLPVEFFIEGTRSRSSKSLPPKFGLLTMLLESFFTGEVPDITFLPVSFTYDHIVEEGLFARELLGVPKPKESTSRFLKAMNLINDVHYGNVYVSFGEPISFRKYVTDTLGKKLSFVHRNPSQETSQTVEFGHHIIDSQQKNMVITCFHLVAIVMSNHCLVGAAGKSLQLEQASREVAWLAAVLSAFGAVVQPVPHRAAAALVAHTVSQHHSVITVSDTGALTLTDARLDPKPFTTCTWKGHQLQEDIVRSAYPMVVLQLYINHCMHFLVSPGIITVIMQHLGEDGRITKHELFEKYKFVCSLMTNEFVFFRPWAEKTFEDALLKLELVSIIEGDSLKLGNHRKLQALLCNLMYPFFSGYLTICKCLQILDEKDVWTEKQLMTTLQAKIEGELKSGHIQHPYCLSLDLISSCIASLTVKGVLNRSRVNGVVNYSVKKDDIIHVTKELECLTIVPIKYSYDKDSASLELDTYKALTVSELVAVQGLSSKL
ncbi:dihydroxyacetone phosphate acyltransferase [Nilaparvata lugens]|uniref:dihydroxyacetone phosphate acyltransferase n=1 Tax=Nilaparvata lugens TaxID=108931 RepID=UPI00193D53BB|nr:dihydroxyacetone phosphate acyltransferase [Nilaparvata lugens]